MSTDGEPSSFLGLGLVEWSDGAGRVMTPYGEDCPTGGPSDVLEAVAAFAGVRAGDDRDRCVAAAARGAGASTRAGLYRVLLRHGGVRPPRLALPPPARSARSFTMAEWGEDAQTRAYFDASAIQRLCEGPAGWRYRHMADVLHGWMGAVGGDRPGVWVSAVLTEVLQRLGDREVRQLPQAVLLALSLHPRWQRAALDWLAPYRDTWVADHLTARSQVGALACFVAADAPWVPSWLMAPRGRGWCAGAGGAAGNADRALPGSGRHRRG